MYCIGLMSGTSVDGIDAASVEITEVDKDLEVKLLAGETYPYPDELREQILAVCAGKPLSMAQFAELDDAIALSFAQAAQKIQLSNQDAQLIGSHGQTLYHRPPTQEKLGYSLQLGRGELIANLTGIPTVSNFRAADLAAGGQGAPLVSKVDAYLLSHRTQHRCIQNIGGIGNVTYLPPRNQANWQQQICGWDTGPGNALIDLAVSQLTNGRLTYDRNGELAAQGTPCQPLIEQWLQQEYFSQPPPKSTGRELFSQTYLAQCWQDAQEYHLNEADWLATLTNFTAASIVDSYRRFLPQLPDTVCLCGGGSRNLYLKQCLKKQLSSTCQLLTTDEVGISGEYKEAIAFAVLAYWRLVKLPGNLPQVTGASQPMLLGEVHLPVSRQYYPNLETNY